MIYNKFGLKFIFIHIPKCGGTSIENALGYDYKNNIGFNFEKKYQNITNIHPKHFKLDDYDRITKIDDYFTFTIIRNPWERMVSNYNFDITSNDVSIHGKNTYNEKKHITFYDYVDLILNTKTNGVVSDYDSWYNTQNKSVDCVCKLENIQSDFSYVCGRIGIDNRFIKHINKTLYIENIPYSDYYNNKYKDLIYNNFKYEILKYKYEF